MSFTNKVLGGQEIVHFEGGNLREEAVNRRKITRRKARAMGAAGGVKVLRGSAGGEPEERKGGLRKLFRGGADVCFRYDGKNLTLT